MKQKYYLDTCIWRDYFENRSDRFRPLGEWALRLIKKIIENEDLVVYSDLTIRELRKSYSDECISEILSIVPPKLLLLIEFSPVHVKQARQFSRKSEIPFEDALHAILAMDTNAILVSRDEHLYRLSGSIAVKKPEELI